MSGDTVRRDSAIDFVRGAGILMIAVDHLAYLAEKFDAPGFINPFITWIRIGWSSAAEFFVFFSGYLVGLVYLKTLQVHGPWMLWARAAQRSWHIYVVNLLTLCAVFVLLHASPFANASLLGITSMDALFGADAATSLFGFLRLQFAPMFFEILGLYVVFLLIAPAVLLGARLSSALVVTLSFVLWLLVQLNIAQSITPALAASQSFNPFAWQFVFVLGMLGGTHRVFDWIRRKFVGRSVLMVTGGLLLLALTLKTLEKVAPALPILGAFHVPDTEKSNLGPLQLAHFLVSVVFVMQIVPRRASIQEHLAFRAVTGVGRRSLECFCLSTILAYAANGLLVRSQSFDVISLLLAGAVMVLLVCAAAPAIEWVDRKPWRSQKRTERQAEQRIDRMPAQLSPRNVP
jgi:hypothetical protein